MKREVLLRALGRIFGVMGTLFMVGIFALESHLAQTGPRVLDAGRGHIYPLNVHGIVYVTGGERSLDRRLAIGAAACWISFALIVYVEIRRRRRQSRSVK